MPTGEPRQSLGDLLRQHREQRGLSQQELAALVEPSLSADTISNLERGRTRPYRHTLAALCRALELDEMAQAAVWGARHALGVPRSPLRAEATNADHQVRTTANQARARAEAPNTETRGPALPSTLSSFIGRDHEVTEVTRAVECGRLVTLTGPGGVGKTRLGLQVGQRARSRFTDGVIFIPLADVRDPGLVVPSIARRLGLEDVGVRPLPALLRDTLADKHLLLILDNFEHVLGAATAVAQLLEACAGLRVLVTSRAPLRVRGEQEFAVPPLRAPDAARSADIGVLSQYEAVQLFVARARAVDARFGLTLANAATVAEICLRLDGLPLAIELAAARLRVLDPRTMLSRLEQRLHILTGGARDLPERQQTMRATIAWSYELLDSAERKLFERLSIFVGGCTIAAAESIAGAHGPAPTGSQTATRATSAALLPLEGRVLDLMESLVSKSLLHRDEGTDVERRFTMLETIREFGLERVAESGEATVLRRRHASAYLAFAERAGQELFGPRQATWLGRLAAEHGNLRAGLDTWQTQQETERAVRVVEALLWFWIVHGHLTEGREATARVATLAAATGHLDLRAKMLAIESTLAFHQTDYGAARALGEQSLALQRTLKETAALSSLLVDLAAAAARQGDPAAARVHLEESLAIARRIGDVVGYSRAANDLANLAHEQADYARAASLFAESLALARQSDDRLGIATVLNNLAVVARDQRDTMTACRLFDESIAVRRAIGDRHGLALTLANLAEVVRLQGDYDSANALLAESLATEHELGAAPRIAFLLECLAGVSADQGRAARALRLAGAAAALRAAIGAAPTPAAQAVLEQRLAPAHRALDQKSGAQAWSEGQALVLDEAVAYGLGGTENLTIDRH